jgi:hypothetical protein
MVPFVLVLVATMLGLMATRRHRRAHLPAQSVIVSPRHSTVVADNGGVRSLQSAELTLPAWRLEQLWNPTNVENLARTYWRFLSRVTLGLIRVVYGENERSVVLLARPLTLLRFAAPEYVLEPGHANVRWRILDGLLVARAGRGSGFLALDARRLETPANGSAKLRIEVEVANFYPAIAAGFSLPVYEATQSSIHVLVTHAFLRSLAKLDLAKSKVGRFARRPAGADNPLAPRPQRNGGPPEPAPAPPPAPAPAAARETLDQP